MQHIQLLPCSITSLWRLLCQWWWLIWKYTTIMHTPVLGSSTAFLWQDSCSQQSALLPELTGIALTPCKWVAHRHWGPHSSNSWLFIKSKVTTCFNAIIIFLQDPTDFCRQYAYDLFIQHRMHVGSLEPSVGCLVTAPFMFSTSLQVLAVWISPLSKHGLLKRHFTSSFGC